MARRRKRSSEPRRPRGAGRREGGRSRGAADLLPDQQRLVIAQQAARIVIEHGIADYGMAKRKAAERLGTASAALLPTNAQVESAVVEHQRLFGGERHAQHLRSLREGACEAMRFFQDFAPRLVGPVLSGAASEHSEVTLHLFTDDESAVPRRLMDRGFAFREEDRRLRYAADRTATHPAYRFSVGGLDYEVLVLPLAAMRQPPISPVDGRAMRGAPLREVEALAAGGAGDAGSPLSVPGAPVSRD